MMQTILSLDRWLFTKINQDWTNPLLDYIYPLWREGITWMPLYIFLLFFILINFGKRGWPWIIGLLVTVSLCDQISSHLIKPYIQRMRPCHDELLIGNIRLLLEYCSDSLSFVSSHATNHFGLAFFLHLTLRPYFSKWTYLFFFWAASISYGQVYIGVHYPTDVLCGALLGSCIGCFTAWVVNKRFKLPALASAV